MSAARIKQLRLNKNYTQEHIAAEANISQSQLSKYESGASIPNITTAKQLAIALQVEVFELFYENEAEIRSAVQRWQKRQL